MLEVAEQRGIKSIQLDAHQLASAAATLGQFDAVLSNAALHWMADLPKVLEGVYAVLKPGGRFVAELGGHGNVCSVFESLRQALLLKSLNVDELSPWTFPSDEEVCHTECRGMLSVSWLLFGSRHCETAGLLACEGMLCLDMQSIVKMNDDFVYRCQQC